MSSEAPPPNATIYFQNVTESLKQQDLRRQLYSLCIPYGRVTDMVTLRTEKMRGQAFVEFQDLQSATDALNGLQGFAFFGKPLRVAYAKDRSGPPPTEPMDGEEEAE